MGFFCSCVVACRQACSDGIMASTAIDGMDLHGSGDSARGDVPVPERKTRNDAGCAILYRYRVLVSQ